MRYPLFCGLGLALVVALALALRLPNLDNRPFHTDEGVQAVKTGILLEQHVYEYDPKEFHGPTLHYFALPVLWLSGDRTFADTTETQFRLVPVLLGALLIALTALLWDGLGGQAVLWAALLAALSPACVFYNRYYIAETPLVCFTFLALAAGWRYARCPHLGWALLCGVALGLMYATKETSAFAFLAMLAALALTWAWFRWVARQPFAVFSAVNGKHLTACVLLGTIVMFVLFSAFFTHMAGPVDSLRSYFHWGEHATAGNHTQPSYFFLKLLLCNKPENLPVWTEGLIVGLALVGAVAGLAQRGLGKIHAGLACFLAFYTVLLTAVYSAIPYKTPWCVLGFLHGMILLAGIGATVLVNALPKWPLKALAVLLLAAGSAHLGVQAYRASFWLPADARNPYNYSPTVPDALLLAARVKELAQLCPQGLETHVDVIAPGSDFWPLPFYLRRMPKVAYWADTFDDPDAAIVIASPAVKDEVERRLPGPFNSTYYGLRPGVHLLLYVRQDLWDAFRERIKAAMKASQEEKGP
jgi:uncharacterized protein (TIGR03663 family)